MIELAITIDDPNLTKSPLLSAEARDERIRAALMTCDNLQAAVFVCGRRVDSPEGSNLLKAWGNENHLLGNHTYSHLNLNDEKVGVTEYIKDIERCHRMISECRGFFQHFRYPFLKGGETKEKCDAVREFLKSSNYRQGYASIDASDWCIDGRLQRALKRNEKIDLTPYREFYLSHIKERVLFYDSLAKNALGRSIKHTLLIHHNLLNALFLTDLLAYLKGFGCTLINAEVAFQDPVYLSDPEIIPFGESIIWALAKENGRYESKLRYPAEDESYEREAMDAAGL